MVVALLELLPEFLLEYCCFKQAHLSVCVMSIAVVLVTSGMLLLGLLAGCLVINVFGLLRVR